MATSSNRTSSQDRVLVLIDQDQSRRSLMPLVERVMAAVSRADRVAVVLTDSTDATALKKRFPALEVQPTQSQDRPAVIAGLAGTHDGPVCIVEARAVFATSRWLGELLAPVLDGEADITLPATNAAPFPSCPVAAPDAAASMARIRSAAQDARRAEASRRVAAMHGPVACFAGGVLTGIGSVESLESIEHGKHRVIEVPRVYVHATEGVPQISVAMIMKNEADELADCLASLRPFADEIVIYDTGSTDDSVELARSLGAVVIEGEWRNDFGWARNQAMEATRGTWILSIDADERLEIDHGVVPEIRGLLGDDPPVERFIIELFDLQGSVHAPVRATSGVPMARLFRRSSCRWVGALHEQPDARPGTPKVRSVLLPGVRYLHRGYLNEYVDGRNKWARNLEVATAGLTGVPDSDKECFDLGRSLRSVGEHARAFALFERAADLDQNPVITRGALEFIVLTLCETGQSTAAAPYLERLRALRGGEGPARYLQGWTHIHLNQWEDAATCFEGLTDYSDNFTGFRVESVSLALAMAYRGLGRREDAAAAASEALRCNDQAIDAWAVLFDCTDGDAPALTDAARSLDLERLLPLFAKLQEYPAGVRDRLADAVWDAHPGNRVVLAVASQLAGQLDLNRMLVWSGRLRSNGLSKLCPLQTVADDGSRTVAERADVLVRAVNDLDAADLADELEKLVGLLHDHELVDLLDRAMQSFPAAAGSVIVAGATSAARCHGIVVCLVTHGYLNEALAVVSHGAELDGDGIRRLLEADPQLARTLRAAAETAGRSDLAPVLPHAA